jgi:hypothetical protein
MPKKRKSKKGQCIYCGITTKLTKDHVIPKGLFVRPYPSNLITVPACSDCNEAKSKNDDFLRDFLICDAFASNSPIAQSIFDEKMTRSITRNSSQFSRIAMSEARYEPLLTRAGIYLGTFPTIPIDEERIKNIFSVIVRGLYYDARHKRIPDNYIFEVLGYRPWDFKQVWEYYKKLHLNGPRVLGKVFGCAFVYAEEDEFITTWLMWFYESVFFSVSSNNPEFQMPSVTQTT